MSFEHSRTWRDRHPGKSAEQSARWRANNPEKSRALNSESNRRLYTKEREAALVAYGGACACCGESDPHFLQLDHVDQVIPEHHRRNGRRVTGLTLLKILRDEGYPDYMRILCANCNFAHGHYGFCPHEEHVPEQRRWAA